jgi:putative transposase
MNKHIDYIHYNPVKHGIANSPLEYEHTSFNYFVENGFYQKDWGNKKITFNGEFGEI